MAEADYCDGVGGNGSLDCLCHEGDLGPKDVSKGTSPAALLHGYRRIGTMKPAAFLKEHRDVIFENGQKKTRWRWPNEKQEGFLLDANGKPICGFVDLEPGTLIDRFGTNDTVYFAPVATPYAMRSLPPSSLNPQQEYAVYRIQKRLRVRAGPIAPGLEQPGLGTQYIAEMDKAELFKNDTWLKKLTREEVVALYKDW